MNAAESATDTASGARKSAWCRFKVKTQPLALLGFYYKSRELFMYFFTHPAYTVTVGARVTGHCNDGRRVIFRVFTQQGCIEAGYLSLS